MHGAGVDEKKKINTDDVDLPPQVHTMLYWSSLHFLFDDAQPTPSTRANHSIYSTSSMVATITILNLFFECSPVPLLRPITSTPLQPIVLVSTHNDLKKSGAGPRVDAEAGCTEP